MVPVKVRKTSPVDVREESRGELEPMQMLVVVALPCLLCGAPPAPGGRLALLQVSELRAVRVGWC